MKKIKEMYQRDPYFVKLYFGYMAFFVVMLVLLIGAAVVVGAPWGVYALFTGVAVVLAWMLKLMYDEMEDLIG